MNTTIIYSKRLRDYDFGEGHPFRSNRYDAFLSLYKAKLGDSGTLALQENQELATDEELRLWHTQEYIEAMKALCTGLHVPHLFKFLSGDNVNPLTGGIPLGMEEAARAIVKNSILAVDTVLSGTSKKAVSLGGGMHHAKAGYGEGFCMYNDVVVAVKYALQEHLVERILILDTDAHAGNGTCEAFYAEPRVLFIDLHQRGIYPGTGSLHEMGEGQGKGFTINLPLASGTGDEGYRLIFEEIIAPVAAEFQPELIIRYGGSDPHYLDNLTSLGLTLRGFGMIGERVRQLSKTLCQEKAVDLICSGYNLDVLAAAWLTLVASLGGEAIHLEEVHPEMPAEKTAETTQLIQEARDALCPLWASLR
jgi:acetoin utilization protein AcuC